MHKTIAKMTSYIVILWTVAAFLVLAFRCGASRPWTRASGQCIDEVSPSEQALGISAHLLGVFNLAWHRTSRYTHRAIHDSAPNPDDASGASRRLEEDCRCGRIHLSGAVRIEQFPGKLTQLTKASVIVATILRLVYLHKAYSSSDFTFSSVNSAIATQCVLCLSVFTACTPCCKPFLNGKTINSIWISSSFCLTDKDSTRECSGWIFVGVPRPEAKETRTNFAALATPRTR